MMRSVAITRINEGLGFRLAGNNLEGAIALRLQEAQRDLEKGKTLPRFLLQEDQPLVLLTGTHTVALPTGFLRESDETRIRFFPLGSSVPTFLERRFYIDAVLANIHGSVDSPLVQPPIRPSVYVLRKSTIDFITTADTTYNLIWDYYKAADVLTGEIENAWLANGGAAEWLIGEAGGRIARDTRNDSAVALFADMTQKGRAAAFGEDITAETASGPLQMGANL